MSLRKIFLLRNLDVLWREVSPPTWWQGCLTQCLCGAFRWLAKEGWMYKIGMLCFSLCWQYSTCTAKGVDEGWAEATLALHDHWPGEKESSIPPESIFNQFSKTQRRWPGLLTSSCLLWGVSEYEGTTLLAFLGRASWRPSLPGGIIISHLT